MAIQYSLPYALLMWGCVGIFLKGFLVYSNSLFRMVAFLAAIMTMCFYDVSGWATLSKRLIYGSTWLFICFLILWTIIIGWEMKHHRIAFRKLRRLLRSCTTKSTLRKAAKQDEEGGDEEEDNRQSAMDIHAARTTMAVQTATQKSWRMRLQKMADKRRQLTRSMTLTSMFHRRSTSVPLPPPVTAGRRQ